jgi:hypothetical protein
VDIWKYLTDGETVLKEFKLSGFDVHATTKRLFSSTPNGSIVQDYDYYYISSVLFKSKRYLWLIPVGAAIIIAALYFLSPGRSNIDPISFWIALAGGIAVIVLGAVLRKKVLRLYVIGGLNPEFQGRSEDLESLFQIIRGKSVLTKPTVPNPG